MTNTKKQIKQSIRFENKTYRVLDKYETVDDEGNSLWLVHKTDNVKTKRFWAWYPILVRKKFKWLTWVEAKYRFYIITKREFNKSNYNFYWSSFKGKWEIEKILN